MASNFASNGLASLQDNAVASLHEKDTWQSLIVESDSPNDSNFGNCADAFEKRIEQMAQAIIMLIQQNTNGGIELWNL